MDTSNSKPVDGGASTFQQPKITGYRQLNQKEAHLMNRLKNVEALFNSVYTDIVAHLQQQQMTQDTSSAEGAVAEATRLLDAQPSRWLSIGRTHVQEGIMAATRAVAQPASPSYNPEL